MKPEPEIVAAWKAYRASDLHAARLARAKEKRAKNHDDVEETLLFMTWVDGYRAGQRFDPGGKKLDEHIRKSRQANAE